jgi:ABC-type Mn2+/Zn2+ transport system permease subunit
VVTAVAVVGIAAGYRTLLFASFDPDVAGAAGVRVKRVEDLLMVLLALAVMATMQVIGAVLVSAILVIPAATARLLTHRFGPMLVTSTALGAGAGLVGMLVSYHLDVPSGAAITLVAGAAFALAALAAAGRGAVIRAAG